MRGHGCGSGGHAPRSICRKRVARRASPEGWVATQRPSALALRWVAAVLVPAAHSPTDVAQFSESARQGT